MDYPQLKRTVYPDSTDRTHTDQAHFRDFRDYHLPLVRLHHTHLTWGIARGLEVRGTLGGTTITVEPGVAVDPQGQLLVLTRAETRATLTFINQTLYVTLQFAEGRGLDGRLEQLPAEQVRLRDAPTLDSGSDEAVVVLALVRIDGTGRVTALQVQDGERRFRRQLLGEQVEALELRRAVREGERVVDVPAGTIAAGEHGGLRLTVAEATDEVLLAREDGGAFRRVEIRADVQVTGILEGTLASGAVGPEQVAVGAVTSVHLADAAVTSARLAAADGRTGQNTDTGTGIKTDHIQDRAVTGDKIANETIQENHLSPSLLDSLNRRPQWVVLPFFPKRLGTETTPAFILDTNHAKSIGQAFGVMEIPIPAGARQITRLRIAGTENGGVITIHLFRAGINDQSTTDLLPQDNRITVRPFDRRFDINAPLDGESQGLALHVHASANSDIWLVAAEFTFGDDI